MTRAAILLAAAMVVAAAADGPQYTADGRMEYPRDYRQWVFLSSGLGMTYGPLASTSEPRFDNVFVNPAAYQRFVENGTWPDGTVLVLEVRSSQSKGSINQGGHFQTDVRGVEVHVKDSRRFERKWAFFGFEGETPAKAIPSGANCYTCHEQHGSVDTTFVQFYPTLIGPAKAHGSLKP